MGRILIYPHLFHRATAGKEAEKLKKKGDIIDFLFFATRFDDIFEEEVEKRMADIVKKYKDDEVVFVLLGYSPLVAVIYKIAEAKGYKTVYFVKQYGDTVEKEIIRR